MPSIIASVSGSFIVNVEPSPSFDVTSTLPRSFSIFFLTTSIPTPRPEILVTLSAVDKPGAKIRLYI